MRTTMTQVKENELPSTRRLLKATAVAIVVAGLILVTTFIGLRAV